MSTINICKNCSTQFQAGKTFCIVCGVLADAGGEKGFEIECETHPDRRAVGLCVICSKPVCLDCRVVSKDKILCTDPEHKILLQDWRILLEPDSEFEADALARNLADGGIEAKYYSLLDHITTHWLNENRICLFVKKLEYDKAKAFLNELNLIDND